MNLFHKNIDTNNTQIEIQREMEKEIKIRSPKKILHKLLNAVQRDLNLPLLIFLCLFCLVTILFLHTHRDAESIQEGIARQIIRFHVIANSDSSEDQGLKFQVKDALVLELSPLLKDVQTIEDGRNILSSQLSQIETIASRVIREQGYEYPVSVQLGPKYFPMKSYGDYSFPPGYYEALQVQIGNASGQNWWCVMFPPLCFVDETYSIVDPDAQEQLSVLLTKKELESLKQGELKVRYKSKLWESIKKIFKK